MSTALFYASDEVQEELRRVIGDRQVQVADRKNLPFTDAVIHETQRLSSIIPTALPHKTTRDITFQGHFIEKVTLTHLLWKTEDIPKKYLDGKNKCNMNNVLSSWGHDT